MPFVAASSEHPLATHAVGEVVGEVLERLGTGPDLAVVFVTGPFAGATADIARTIRELLWPANLLAATAVSVVAGSHEIEGRAAVSLFAASWGGRMRLGSRGARTVRFAAEREASGWHLTGTEQISEGDATLLLLAEPNSFPLEESIEGLHERHPNLTVVGATASVPPTVGANLLVADGHVQDHGAVGVLLPAGTPLRVGVSQGSRPVGPALVVTAADGNLIEEIAGRPALDRLMEIVEDADPLTKHAMASGLGLGIVLDESHDEPEPGDVLVRPVLGGERNRRAVAVGSVVDVGTTVQFQVRDPTAADDDLHGLLDGEEAEAALVFKSEQRGEAFFGFPDHDAAVVDGHVRAGATAGMFGTNVTGPVAGMPAVHDRSAVVVLFDA
ncbi:MAG: FIST C-terminal domain-containing protein [Acidimicrobiales bacterium]|nr:FIST C-terminal domain-containing protein [Acidimicrobiales bacterium]